MEISDEQKAFLERRRYINRERRLMRRLVYQLEEHKKKIIKDFYFAKEVRINDDSRRFTDELSKALQYLERAIDQGRAYCIAQEKMLKEKFDFECYKKARELKVRWTF